MIETKGLEDLDVALKDRCARRWCRDPPSCQAATGAYEKVRQRVFDAYTGDDVDGLRRSRQGSGSCSARAASGDGPRSRLTC